MREKILVIRLSAIGDVMHCFDVVHNLRLGLPNAHITWLVSPPADELVRANVDVDQILLWDRRPLDKAVEKGKFGKAWGFLQEARALLAQESFDIVLDLQCLLLTGILASFTHAKRRIGIHERHEGNFFFMTEMAPKTEAEHKILRYRQALLPLGIENFRPGISLNLKDEQKAWAKAFWEDMGLKGKRILMVNVRTTWPDKNWPPEYFGEALKGLPQDVAVVFCGSEQDLPFIEKAQAKLKKSYSIAGKTSLMELASLFSAADLLFTCDTGPLYIAEAVGLPALSLWGPTHPKVYGPLTGENMFLLSDYECAGCGKTKCIRKTNACMLAIKPQRARELLAKFFAHE